MGLVCGFGFVLRASTYFFASCLSFQFSCSISYTLAWACIGRRLAVSKVHRDEIP